MLRCCFTIFHNAQRALALYGYILHMAANIHTKYIYIYIYISDPFTFQRGRLEYVNVPDVLFMGYSSSLFIIRC